VLTRGLIVDDVVNGSVLPAIFAGIAIVQFFLACVVFVSLIYFVIRDYIELQQRRRVRAGNGLSVIDSTAFTPCVLLHYSISV